MKNVRHFLGTVKAATGNTVDKNDRQAKGGPKPGACLYCVSGTTKAYLPSHARSERHYPGDPQLNAGPWNTD